MPIYFWRLVHFRWIVLAFPFRASLIIKRLLETKTSLLLAGTREKIEVTLNMLWVISQAISILSPSKRLWTKDKSDVETVETSSSWVSGKWEEKISNIFINWVPPRKHHPQCHDSFSEKPRPRIFIVPLAKPSLSISEARFDPPLSK